jgi:hypothetical protein
MAASWVEAACKRDSFSGGSLTSTDGRKVAMTSAFGRDYIRVVIPGFSLSRGHAADMRGHAR